MAEPTSSPPPPASPQQKIPVSIQDEMRTSYLDYAMSVIIGRAFRTSATDSSPSTAASSTALTSRASCRRPPIARAQKSSATCSRNYHPHGDAAVYDAMVRLAQDFSMRYPLIDGQGNFGSVDGDPPAAYRYTEARLTQARDRAPRRHRLGVRRLRPRTSTTRSKSRSSCRRTLPNLLVNGSGGIAVGMATNIPPHNLGEVSTPPCTS